MPETACRARWAPLFGAAVLLALAGCGWFTPPDPPDPVPDEVFALAAGQPVAAGQVVIAHGAGTELVLVKAMQDGMSVRAATSGTSTVVAWVTSSARPGGQVQVGFTYAEGSAEPVIANAKAYASSGGPDIGSTLILTANGSQVSEKAPLSLQGLDHAQAGPLILSPQFADYRLGDVDADGTVSVHDALRIRDLAGGSGGNAQQLYHSDLDGDDDTDADDVQRALDKIVDPELPPLLVVKPSRLTFVQLAGSGGDEGFVLVGNGGNEPLAGLSWSQTQIAVSEEAGIAGQSAVLRIGPAPDRDWLPETLVVSDADGGSGSVMLGNLVVLIAGQSNASGRGAPVSGWPDPSRPSVRMLANNFRWQNASEPLDSAAGQTDAGVDEAPLYSFGTRLGHLLQESLGYDTYLLPAAKGGSTLALGTDHGGWRPSGNLLDRDTLFGAANFRAQVSAGRVANPSGANAHDAEGGPVNVVVWYQGESEDTSTEQSVFKAYTREVFEAFEAQLGARVVYVQLASEYDPNLNVRYHAVAEMQRQMEDEQWIMVVAHDLPRSDQRHISAFAQRELAERIALAIREHVFGEDVDGTGPRLLSSSHGGNQVFLTTDRPLQVGPLDEDYFLVFDGVPVGDYTNFDGSYYANAIEVVAATVEASDPSTVRLTLASPLTKTPYVRYMTPPQRWVAGPGPDTSQAEVMAQGVVRGEDGLPLPTFGPLRLPL